MSTTETHPAVERARRDVAAVMAGTDWQARAEVAEAKLDAVHEYCQTYRGDEGMTLACEDILGITGTEKENQ